MSKRIIYFACHYSSSNHRWYSSGGNTKVLQTLRLLEKISEYLIFINLTPKERNKIIPNTINICSSHNKLIYSLEILFSFLKIKKYLKANEKLIIIVYNPRFTSLLFFISSILFLRRPKLIVQVEDIPGARNNFFDLIDKISFKILSIFANHILFASNGMLKKYREEYPRLSNISIYPPSLSNEFIEIINKRKLPFGGKYVNIIYAGGYTEEKGIFDLLKAFKELNLKNYKLNVYGYFPNNIKKRYSKNKTIIFHGFVSNQELIKSYSKSDIVVNPHRLINNNNYIFPCKNIEIFASRAFPIVSEFSISGFDLLDIKDLCTYKKNIELKELIKNAPLIWENNVEKFENFSKCILENYSEDKIFNRLKKITDDL
tara:strand:+ start:8455 stop:9573 length:1119 start_codon:yes stop_codon:yes gene_type:complete